jgi:hypothetical protein
MNVSLMLAGEHQGFIHPRDHPGVLRVGHDYRRPSAIHSARH